MAYDIHTFATSSAYYSEYTKQQVQNLLAASESMYDSAINFAELRIREAFERRELYVLFEQSLNCDPATDHVAPKNVYPLFEPEIEAEMRELKAMEKTSLIVHLESLIFTMVEEELRLRLHAQRQVETLNIEVRTLGRVKDSLEDLVQEQMDEIQRMKKLSQEFEFQYEQELVKKEQMGKVYRLDHEIMPEEKYAEYHGNELLISQLRRELFEHLQEKEELQTQLSAALNNLRDLDIFRDQAVAYESELSKANALLADFSVEHEDSVKVYKTKIEVLKDENERIPQLNAENEDLRMRIDRLGKLLTANGTEESRERQEYEAQIASLADQLKSLQERSKWQERELKEAYEQLRLLKSGSKESNEVKTEESRESEESKGRYDIKGIEGQLKQDYTAIEAAERYEIYEMLIRRLTGLDLVLENAETRKRFNQTIPAGDSRVRQAVDEHLSKLKLDARILSKCHYLFKHQPTFKSAEIEADWLPNASELGAAMNPGEDTGELRDYKPEIGQFAENDRKERKAGLTKLFNSKASIAQEQGDETPRPESGLELGKMSILSADDPIGGECPVYMGDFPDCDKNINTVFCELQNALGLVEAARRDALESLEQYADKQIETGELAVSFESERRARAKRAGDRARNVLRLSRFTLEYHDYEGDYDIPEVFKRLYEAAQEITRRRNLLREEMLGESTQKFLRQRSAFDQVAGMPVSSVVQGNSMIRVDRGDSSSKSLKRVYELPAKSGVTSKAESGAVFHSRPESAGPVSRSELTDKELFEAVFHTTDTKEANYQLRINNSE